MGYRSPNEHLVIRTQFPSLLGTIVNGTTTIGLSASNTIRPFRIASLGGKCSLGLSGNAAARKIAISRGVVAVGFVTTRITTATEPGPFTHVTVTRNYDLADGEAAVGTIFFTPSDWMLNNGVTVVGASVGVKLDGEGIMSAHLAANTDAGTFPGGSYYIVREAIMGQPDRIYKVRIPHNYGATVDLSVLPKL